MNGEICVGEMQSGDPSRQAGIAQTFNGVEKLRLENERRA